MSNWIFFAVITCFSLFGCSKSNDNNNNNGNKATLLTSSTWKFNAAGADLNNDGVKDYDAPAALLTPCDIDNIITFKSDKTGVMDEGASKCDPTDPQKVSFTWSLINDNTLNVSTALFPGLDGDAKILELSSTKFTISKPINYNGVPVTVIIFFTH